MPIGFVRRIITFMILAIAASCSLYNKYEDRRPANVLELETRLEQAGFTRIPIATPEQNGAVAQLPMHQLNRYQSTRGNVFWYADPTVCSCLYQGDEQAYQRYVGELEQEQQTAQYVNDVSPDQVVYLNPFGYAFPPPLIYGGFPVLIPSGPPPVIRPGGGGGGGGPHPHPVGGGGGGGIHSHGGGGGDGGGRIHSRH